MSGYSFPLAATTITDDFNRADENPIGAPWDTTTFWATSGYGVAKISGNQLAPATTSGSETIGGCDYTPISEIDMESVITLSVENNSDYNEFGVRFGSEASQMSFISVGYGSGVIYTLPGGPPEYNFPISLVTDDRLGFRRIGTTLEIWYYRVTLGSWSHALTRNCPATSGLPYCYLQQSAGTARIQDFSVAAVGQLLPPPFVHGRGAA